MGHRKPRILANFSYTLQRRCCWATEWLKSWQLGGRATLGAVKNPPLDNRAWTAPQIHPPPQCPSHFCCLSLPNQAWGPTLPNLVTLGYLHPSPPMHWATVPLSAAQGECACHQRAGPVHGAPPSLTPLASQDLWMGSAGCSARVYCEC